MTAGFKSYDAAGNPEITISTRFTRILGAVQASGSGSINVPDLAEGTPFMLSRPQSTGVNIFSGGAVGVISGTTISWSGPATFLYGIY